MLSGSKILNQRNFYGWTTSGIFYDCFLSSSIKQDDLTRQDMGQMSEPVHKITVQCSLDLRLQIKFFFHGWTTSGAFYDCFTSSSIKWDGLTRQDIGGISEPVNKITVKYSLLQWFWIKKKFHGWTTSGSFYDCFTSSSIKWDGLTKQDMGEMSEPVNKITVKYSLVQRFWIKK
jgi:hypothetical protein